MFSQCFLRRFATSLKKKRYNPRNVKPVKVPVWFRETHFFFIITEPGGRVLQQLHTHDDDDDDSVRLLQVP
jgi:hypothetical protein